jgi:(2Fe-2S) ferredoxin
MNTHICTTYELFYGVISEPGIDFKSAQSTKREKTMAIPERQIILCQSFRVAGDKKGICHKQTDGFLQYIEEEVLDRGLDCLISATTCLKQCDSGPIMVIQPENWWFKGVDSEEAIDTILDGLEDGAPAAEYLVSS